MAERECRWDPQKEPQLLQEEPSEEGLTVPSRRSDFLTLPQAQRKGPDSQRLANLLPTGAPTYRDKPEIYFFCGRKYSSKTVPGTCVV